jgi:uncharacterized membrane protein YdfJ with MMPL/SSD domain
VRFAKPAHNDQKSLDKLKQQQQAAQQQEQQAVEAGEEEGLSQQQAEQQAAASEPSAEQQKKQQQQEQFLKSTASDPDLVKLENQIKRTPGVESVTPAKVDKTGTAAVFTAIPRDAPSSEGTQDLVETLRDDTVPKATKGTDLTAYVGGTTAGFIDLGDRIAEKLPSVILIVVALSFLLLMLAFRSIVVPATAIAVNLLSVGAAYGLLVLVFQEGVGTDVLGFQQVERIDAWVPVFLFSVLFGLSMDYQVFLLSRIHERYRATGSTREGIIHGVASTARLITGAALIIVVVFAGFATGELVAFQQMGFGVAVALLVDATIVRSVVIPAAMGLLAERNWYLPSWLHWLPDVQVEAPTHDVEQTPAPGEHAHARPL